MLTKAIATTIAIAETDSVSGLVEVHAINRVLVFVTAPKQSRSILTCRLFIRLAVYFTCIIDATYNGSG